MTTLLGAVSARLRRPRDRTASCRCRLQVALLLCCVACATVAPAGPVAPKRTQLESAAVLRALAPDFVARAERATAAFEQATDQAERGVLAQRADLLWQAAAAEAELVALQRRVTALELRIEQASQARGQAERARRDAQAAAARAETAARQRALARRVFAALVNGTRSPGAEGHDWPDESVQAEFLAQRAQMLLAAAVALAPDPEQAKLALQLRAAEQATPRERRKLAEAGLRAALQALGRARKVISEPNLAQQQDLLAEARVRGFDAEASQEGVVISLARAFGAGRSDLVPESRRRLELLRDLLAAFPRGSIRVVCSGSAALGGDRRQRVAALLSSSERVTQSEGAPAVASHAELELVLAAYTAPAIAEAADQHTP